MEMLLVSGAGDKVTITAKETEGMGIISFKWVRNGKYFGTLYNYNNTNIINIISNHCHLFRKVKEIS